MQKDRNGRYKIRSGEIIRICMNSDFFLPEADEWRSDAWEMMRIRSDVKFFLLTKRPGRVCECLPSGWGDCWDNIFFNVIFNFIETGTVFIKGGKTYRIPSKRIQSEMAYKSGMNFKGKSIKFRLTHSIGLEIPKEELYVPHYRENSELCASKLTCNGCSDCGKCK